MTTQKIRVVATRHAVLDVHKLAFALLEVVDLLDDDERHALAIEGATLIPLMTLPQRARELDPKAEVVAYCKMGSRSEQAVLYLRRLGFLRAKNLDGGIDAWIQRVDPSLPSY